MNLDKGEPSQAKHGNLLPTLSSSWMDRILKYYLIPEAPFLKYWNIMIVLISIINVILLTFMAAFQYHDIASWFICYLIDLLYLIDMYQKCHVAYLQNGFWVVFPKEMLMNYVTSWEFRFDIISNFPVDLFGFIFYNYPNTQYYVSIIRLTKVVRSEYLFRYFRKQEKKLHSSFALQVVKFITFVIVINHTVACIWFAIGCPNGIGDCNDGSWVKPTSGFLSNGGTLVEIDYNSTTAMYVASIYWTVTTMTTTGYGDIHPNNLGERVYALVCMILGTFFYGYVSGTIASTLSNMDSSRVAYRQKLDAVKQYMADRKMDVDMQHRVLDYYDYVWDRNKGLALKNMFEDMPSAFRREVALNLNNQIIDSTAIFKQCSIGFRRHIAIHMTLHLITANEYVAHVGEFGTELYFISQGRIDIFSPTDKRPTSSLIEGAHFGEYAVILGHRHEYSARAVCNTDIFVLTKEHLEEAFVAFPADRESVYEITQGRYKSHLSTKKSRQHQEEAEEEEEDGPLLPETVLTPAPDHLTTGRGHDTGRRKSSASVFGEYGTRKQSMATSGFMVMDAKTRSNHQLSENLGSIGRLEGDSHHGSLSRKHSVSTGQVTEGRKSSSAAPAPISGIRSSVSKGRFTASGSSSHGVADLEAAIPEESQPEPRSSVGLGPKRGFMTLERTKTASSPKDLSTGRSGPPDDPSQPR
ncbi:uncharacterized protein BJ171DRAFT_598652 [Polychytrium aggregatum]|uniref:uncharacterized protein n=1 Tax=Polychytrium aggregatum TaxID=110093 RepID=UPI0022FEE47F|nr:uncharacterized protein BJ171DRAFT_598652 [Polychytrium aggregatum]KAI9205068.1 hypothetical protein BJ171DRAFT_598652 [Polychytrium aggregatum]